MGSTHAADKDARKNARHKNTQPAHKLVAYVGESCDLPAEEPERVT